MTTDAGTIVLPLLTLGLPGRVSGWLLDAGTPVAPLETSAVRRGIAPEGADRSIVLFDSRNASARTDAEAAEALGYETIDAARLLTGRAVDDDPELTVVPESDPRRRFFDALRPAVEAAGGLWIRIADFPHPYRWAVCGEADDLATLDSHREAQFATALSSFAELPRTTGSAGRLHAGDLLKTCAATGRPVRVAGDAAAVLARHKRKTNSSPLTWVTTLVGFSDWWRFRRRLTVRAVRQSRHCVIETTIPDGASDDRFTPALEIWRGRHVAVVPLRPGRTTISDDAIPFQTDKSRHPAGFTADAIDSDFAGLPGRAVATAPA